MTAKQWILLDLLEHYGGQGTMEVEIQYADETNADMGGTEAEQSRAFFTNRLVVNSLVRSLVKKGYASDTEENGYDITDAGRALL